MGSTLEPKLSILWQIRLTGFTPICLQFSDWSYLKVLIRQILDLYSFLSTFWKFNERNKGKKKNIPILSTEKVLLVLATNTYKVGCVVKSREKPIYILRIHGYLFMCVVSLWNNFLPWHLGSTFLHHSRLLADAIIGYWMLIPLLPFWRRKQGNLRLLFLS